MPRRALEKPDIMETGAPQGGQPQRSDQRLFMQLLAFGSCTDTAPLIAALQVAAIEGALYEDLNDPRGVALLTMHKDPDHFLIKVRRLLNRPPFSDLAQKPQYTMLGRTYSLGYEPDLVEVLCHRPRRSVLNPAWPWAVWYPLRRRGAFTQLAPAQQRAILSEHGTIGRAFGEADYAHDIRLACHGLDTNDNDFVIGLTGQHLYPLSALVQTMRKTKQTSKYLERLGPFMVGKAIWQSPV